MPAKPARTIMRKVFGRESPNEAPILLPQVRKRNGVHGNLLDRSQGAMTFSLRKEVIQPQVLLRLPCYDFTPIMTYTLDGFFPCGSACGLLVQSTFVM